MNWNFSNRIPGGISILQTIPTKFRVRTLFLIFFGLIQQLNYLYRREKFSWTQPQIKKYCHTHTIMLIKFLKNNNLVTSLNIVSFLNFIINVCVHINFIWLDYINGPLNNYEISIWSFKLPPSIN